MKVIILAGGKGSRLNNQTDNLPKVLVPVADKPILEHQIELLEKHGLSDIRLALGFMAEEVTRYLNGRYEYVIETEPLGTGGAIKNAARDLAEPFMVLNGDIISDVDLRAFAASHQPGKNILVVAHHKQNTDYGLLDIDADGRVRKFLEKPNVPTDGHVNVGFYILEPRVFAAMPDGRFSVEYDVFPRLAQQGALHSFHHSGFWDDLGTAERLARVRKMFEKGISN